MCQQSLRMKCSLKSLHSILAPRSHLTLLSFFIFLFAGSRRNDTKQQMREKGEKSEETGRSLPLPSHTIQFSSSIQQQTRTAEIKESLFEELMKKQKNKKVYSSRCDLGASKECKLLSEHSSHSDYWHRCYYILFYFSSVFAK